MTATFWPIDFRRWRKLLLRAWRIYVRAPMESQFFLPVTDLPVLAKRVAVHPTGLEPKQVAVDHQKELAFVSCMKGKRLQIFRYGEGLTLVGEINFADQCVEVALSGSLCFVTSTNFARDADAIRGIHKRNHLTIIEIPSRKILSTVETGGNWSKVIKVHPSKRVVFISNWHSHDLSVIEIKDPTRPLLLQRIACGEAPRGIAFTNGGKTVLVTGFYSGNVIELQEDGDGFFHVEHVGERFDYPSYSGNLRDILIDPDDENFAWISNLGRNLVHRYLVTERKFTDSILVGRSPNSLSFIKDVFGTKLLVSCRGSNAVLIIDTKTGKVVGRSEWTGRAPTGLAAVSNGFLVTGFADNTIELDRF